MIIDELIALLGFETKGTEDLRRFNDSLSQAEKRAEAVATRINAMSVAVGTFLGQVAYQAASRIASVVGSLPGDVLAVGKEFENLGIRFETLEGSAEKGREALEWVRQFAVDTPLDLAQAANAYARLKNFGIDPTNGSLLAMVDAMAASGQGLQMLERLTLATGQAWAKGKLQGEEILQLVEAGVPVWEMLEKATGKSAAELQKLSSAGKLGRDVIQQLIDEIGKKYVGASEKMAKTLDGIQDKITEAWTNFKKEVADRGFYDEFKRRAQEVLDTLEGWEKSGALGRAADVVSRFLTGSMQFAERVGRVLWDIGKAAYYTAAGITDLISKITGLNTVASAGLLGAAILGSTGTGRAMLAALAKRIPWLAAFLVVEDIMSALRGDDSYITQLEGGSEAIDAVREKFDALRRALEKLSETFDLGLDWSAIAAPGDFIDKSLVAFIQELANEVDRLANAITALAKGNIWEAIRGALGIEFTPGGLAEVAFGPEAAPSTKKAPPLEGVFRWVDANVFGGTLSSGPHRSRFDGYAPEPANADALRAALGNLQGNLAKMNASSAAQAVVNDNSVANDNRDQSVNVGSPNVTVNVQQAVEAPAAAGAAVGNAVGAAAGGQLGRRVTGN